MKCTILYLKPLTCTKPLSVFPHSISPLRKTPAAFRVFHSPVLPIEMARSAAVLGLLVVVAVVAEAAGSAPGPHIADLNVLLPPRMTNPVGYRLQGTDGCFSWSWDHHDILRVQPEYNDSSKCSTSARLVSIAPYSKRKETAVYATDHRSGVTIRCKVFIDMISRIQIFHHAVKIDLDELATLRIRAFDHEENVFSSLVGLQFLWQLEPISSKDKGQRHLVHVPLKETPLSDCGGFCGDLDTQIEMEDRGLGSDLYVVKGIEIGHEVVSAQLLEPLLEHVADKIVLTVAEAMSLTPPSPVFVTIGALIYYSLRVIRANIPQVIGLPSPHHQWSVTNSSVARVDSKMGIVYALNLGITNIVVEDTRLSGHVQTSSMHVVIPDKLVLYITPLPKASIPLEGTKLIPPSGIWYVFPGQEYIINIKVFSQGLDANEVHITENTDLKLESSTSKYWEIFSVSDELAVMYDRQKYRLLKPISEGQGTVNASLIYYSGNKENAEVLNVVQGVTVCTRVKFRTGEEDEFAGIIRLPWVPGVYQEVELQATGGCGRTLEDYIWFSSEESTVSVSTSGFIVAKRPGQAVIKVVSIFDSVNCDEVVIEVSIPSSMTMLPNFPVEVVTDTQLQAAVTFRTSSGSYFYRCDAFNSSVRWQLFSESKTFKILNTTEKLVLPHMEGSKRLDGQPCAWTYLHASAAGRAMLHATLSAELQPSFLLIDEPIILKTAASIAAYSPLVVHQAGNGNHFGGYWIDLSSIHAGILGADDTHLDELYLAPGSEMDVVLLGGPERWDQRVEFVETTDVLSEDGQSVTDGVLIQQVSSGSGRLYRVLCQTLGMFKLLFTRGNLVGDGHPMPAVTYVELAVVCSFPSSISLIANEPANTPPVIETATKADRSSERIRTAPIIVANGCTIRIAAVGIHMTGRAFANSSSLCIRWELIGCEELASWNGIESFKRSLGIAWERFLVLHDASGLCAVRATVIGRVGTSGSCIYEKDFFLESAGNVLTDAIQLQIVSTIRVIPESVLLVFDPEAKINLYVTGGTCFLNVITNDTQVTQLTQPSENAECSQLMLSARGLGTALVTVWDIGLSPPASASALVKVANVDWIKIISEEEISLMAGSTKDFDISAGTKDGWIFNSSQYMYMNIHLYLDGDILELVGTNDYSRSGGWLIFMPHFSVRAVTVGVTTLFVSVKPRHGYEILSQIIKVEVFEPLRLHPEHVYLAPGASYVLTVKGGPTIGSFVEYSSMHEGTAIVQGSSGRISAISIGNTTVRAAVFGSNGAMVCEAYGGVQVGIPSMMILNLQSDQLCIGCKMPIFPSFYEGSLLSFYEVCKDYKWTIDNRKVLGFQASGSLHYDVQKTPLSCGEGQNNACDLDDSNTRFINVLFGRSAGRTRVSISFSCDFMLSGISHPVSYNASEMLTVISDPPLALGMPITWVLPPFYTTSNLLPRSSESNEHLHSADHKRTTTYNILKACGRKDIPEQDYIGIDGGKIKTAESNELACIQAKDQVTGRTEVATCVRTAQVAQVRVRTMESSFHVAYLPMRTRLELAVGYCDHLGYPFYEAHGVVPLDVETNYPDIVSIQILKGENATVAGQEKVILQARRPGKALVMITINHNPKKADFIMVSVGAQLYPRNPIMHVGHYLNFTVTNDGIDDLETGQWFSSNGSILSINRISGEAYACTEGAAQVIFRGSDVKLQTTVTVNKFARIIVDAPAVALTNVPFPSEGYKFNVKFSGPYDNSEAAGDPVEVPYDCRVDPSFVGYAKPWSDHGTGNSYCLFLPFSPEQLWSSMSMAKATRSEDRVSREGPIYISIIASLREAPQIMGFAHVLFVGGFSVDLTELNLTPNSNQSLIRVMGNTDVEIDWNRKDLLLVTPLRKDGFGIGGLTEYQVAVLKDQKFVDKITIVHPVSGQKMEIDISYEQHGRRSIMPAARTSGAIWSAIGVCVIVMIATALIFMKLLDRPDRTTVPSSRPMAVGSASLRSSEVIMGAGTDSVQASPRTPPQPFVEYVRRTIDETPYYKREGRRRFDPQRTY